MQTRQQLRTCFFAFILAAGVLPGIAFTQIAVEIQTGVGLGHTSGATPSTPVALGDDRVAILSPSALASNSPLLVHLIIIDRLHGVPQYGVMPVSTSATSTELVWTNPVALDDRTLLMPSPGADGFYGTSDDQMTRLENLHQPVAATQTDILVGAEGPLFGGRLLDFGNHTIAWIDRGADRILNTSDDLLRVMGELDDQSTLMDLPLGMGATGQVLDLGEGAYAVLSSGPDRVVGNQDDVAFLASYDAAVDGVVMKLSKLHQSIAAPFFGGSWPQGQGGEFVFPGTGRDQRLGTPDDVLVFVDDKSTTSREVVIGHLGAMTSWVGPANVSFESDGTLVMTAPGADYVRGTSDDLVLFVRSPFSPQGPSVEALALGQSLFDRSSLEPNKSVTLPCDTTLVTFRDEIVPGAFSGGVVVIRKLANGTHASQVVDFGEGAVAMHALGENSAVVFLESGAVVHFHGLDTASPSFQSMSTQTAAAPEDIVVISPSVIVGTRKGDESGGGFNDHLQLWRLRAAFAFGESTRNDQGYAMSLTSTNQVPAINGPAFFLQLQGAPPSSFGYMLISTSRGSFLPAVDAEVFLEVESMIEPQFRTTTPDGQAFHTIVPLSDPALSGITLNCQFLIVNPAAPRNYELSNGLTLVF